MIHIDEQQSGFLLSISHEMLINWLIILLKLRGVCLCVCVFVGVLVDRKKGGAYWKEMFPKK